MSLPFIFFPLIFLKQRHAYGKKKNPNHKNKQEKIPLLLFVSSRSVPPRVADSHYQTLIGSNFQSSAGTNRTAVDRSHPTCSRVSRGPGLASLTTRLTVRPAQMASTRSADKLVKEGRHDPGQGKMLKLTSASHVADPPTYTFHKSLHLYLKYCYYSHFTDGETEVTDIKSLAYGNISNALRQIGERGQEQSRVR